MSGPGSARQRLSDADRDRTAEALGSHYVDGRLDSDALGQRIEALYAMTFLDEADALLADLPAAATTGPKRRRRSGWLGRRHGEADAAEPGWRPTPERFLDPTTNRVMRVWIDPSDSSRHYVAEQ